MQELGQSRSSSILRTIVDESIMESSFAENIGPELDTTGTTSYLEDVMEDTETTMESSQAGDTSIQSAEECTIAANPPEPPPTVAAPVTTEHMRVWRGFRLVGDNVDKNVRPSFQRIDRRTQSLHYFNAYAVMDRVDLTGFFDEPIATAVFPKSLLPHTEDVAAVKEDFVTLVSR